MKNRKTKILFFAIILLLQPLFAQDKISLDPAESVIVPTPGYNPGAPPIDPSVPVQVEKKATTKKKSSMNKKKLKKHKKVKYADINIAAGIRKEVYFDFPLGSLKGPTDPSIFKFDINKKEQDPKLNKDRIVLTGLKPGMTDLWVYDNKDVLKCVYNVTVTLQNLKRILGFLKHEFRNIEGLKMYIREQLIVLDGEILLPEDIARIHQFISGFENVFKIQYKLNPTLYNIIAAKMEKEIGMPDVHVEVVNQRFVLKGTVNSDTEKEYATNKAALYLPKWFYIPSVGDPTAVGGTGAGELVAPAEEFRDQPIIYYFLTVKIPDAPIKKVIKMAVYFIEIAKGFENDFGFTWAPSIDTSNSKMNLSYSTSPAKDSSGNEIQPFVGTITGIINNFIPKLKDIVDHKRGRVIQSAAISIEDGQSGNINKTTNYPYLLTSPTQGATTASAPVGMGIGITPTIVGNKETSMDVNVGIEIKVSQVVSMSQIGVPVTSEDGVKTSVNLKSDETAAVGGIVNNISSRSYGNGGSDENIIINLSRSKSFQRNKSQFVVFITPTILKSASDGSNEVKEKFRIR
ncbi:MAG: hypothetical protein WCQ47_01145 [bacterium]